MEQQLQHSLTVEQAAPVQGGDRWEELGAAPTSLLLLGQAHAGGQLTL